MLPNDPTTESARPDSSDINPAAADAGDAGDEPPAQPGYVAGPAPVPVGHGPRRLGRVVVGVAIALVVVLGGGALFASGYMLGIRQVGQPGTSAADSAAFQPFWDAYHNVSTQYALGPVDQKTLVEGAIKGLVDSLGDPYSAYLSPDDFKNTLQDISGSFEGIGAEIGTVDATGKTVTCTTFGPDCRLEIANPLPDSPALKAGLQAGDVVTAIDGTTVDGLTPDDTTNRIRGPAGTAVTLRIDRAGSSPFDVKITRAKIQRQEVVAKDLAGGKVGYVALTGFSEAGPDAAIAAIKADVQKGQKAIVLDLRGNPGGFIDAAQRLASAFIASGPVFWQEDVNGHQSATPAIPGGVATDPSIRVVVLVDGGTASAAEIVTGALKDTRRATIVGQKTFGKGTVQTWYPLGSNGDEGGIKLTVAKWLTPDKTWIHKVGITPDVVVDVPANLPAGSDPVLDKALAVLAAPPASPAPGASTAPAGSPVPPASSAPSSSVPSSSVRSFLLGWQDVA